MFITFIKLQVLGVSLGVDFTFTLDNCSLLLFTKELSCYFCCPSDQILSTQKGSTGAKLFRLPIMGKERCPESKKL